MSANRMILIANQKTILTANTILGALGIICAPMLMLQFLFGEVWKNATDEKYSPAIAALGVLYIGGWMCGAIGMFRQRIYGENLAAKIVFALQMIFLTLAFLFSTQETLGISFENGGGTFFFVCDMGYPASHLFMIVIGIFGLLSKHWHGITKFAPFLVGAALPLTMATGWFLGMIGGMVLFGVLTTIGLGIIGFFICSNEKLPVD